MFCTGQYMVGSELETFVYYVEDDYRYLDFIRHLTSGFSQFHVGSLDVQMPSLAKEVP
jgi:hypothetical protein